MHGICRVNEAECVIRMRAAALQEYVNSYSTRRLRVNQAEYGIRMRVAAL